MIAHCMQIASSVHKQIRKFDTSVGYRLTYVMDSQEDFVLERRLELGKRAKRTLKKEEPCTYHNNMGFTHLKHKSWEKKVEDMNYEMRRNHYMYLETIHRVLAPLPHDIIYIIQEKANMPMETMPLPKVLYVAK